MNHPFTPPFRLGPEELYIYDAKGNMAGDFDHDGTPRPRGWGRVQSLPDGILKMLTWLKHWVEVVGEARDPAEVVARLNTTTLDNS